MAGDRAKACCCLPSSRPSCFAEATSVGRGVVMRLCEPEQQYETCTSRDNRSGKEIKRKESVREPDRKLRERSIEDRSKRNVARRLSCLSYATDLERRVVPCSAVFCPVRSCDLKRSVTSHFQHSGVVKHDFYFLVGESDIEIKIERGRHMQQQRTHTTPTHGKLDSLIYWELHAKSPPLVRQSSICRNCRLPQDECGTYPREDSW